MNKNLNGISDKEMKRIMESVVDRANEMQKKVVDEYEEKHGKVKFYVE